MIRTIGGPLTEARLREIVDRSQTVYCTNNPGDLPRGVADLVQADIPDLVAEIRRLRPLVEWLAAATTPLYVTDKDTSACGYVPVGKMREARCALGLAE